MTRKPATPRFQHSLWDRLTNPELIRGESAGVIPAGDIKRLREEVRRDLEWLLNSRSAPVVIPEGLDALQQSLIRYGLPDFTTLNLSDPKERERFQNVLAEVIRAFEPRLHRVEVRFDSQNQDRSRATLHYQIQAILSLDTAPQPVVFDTVLELGSKTFLVRSEAG
jgi:type VI secretion system protein ImpF